MSNIEQIDFSTLIWVKKELDETLKRAQNAIEKYVEDPEDENQLQFCATYLHQVQGTLKMVELYGAAMVAEEMEEVAKKILNKDVDSEKDAFEVLMRGIILLPDYLERIQLGYKDIPMVLLPLVNDLRTVKGDQLLSESALFNPDLSLGLPKSNLSSTFSLSQSQLSQVVIKIRTAYQVCLLNWLKDVNVDENLKKLQVIVDKLKTIISPVEEKQLFWVAGGLSEALLQGSLEKSVTVKQLCGRLDQAIRMLTADVDKDKRIYQKLTNNLLYYVALADGKDRRTKEIQTFFNLSDFISDDKEIEHAQSSLSGKNKELLESVTSVIKEDLMTIQENLDLYNRNENPSISDLESISYALGKISDTIGIIGIGVARSKISKVIETLNKSITKNELIDKNEVMNIAETLLYVGSSLDENIISLGEVSEPNEKQESTIPSSEMRKIMDTLAKESITNLQKVKQNFIIYIEAPWNKESIEPSPKLLKEISGALTMSGYEDVAVEIDRIEEFTTKYMLESNYKPTVDQLDLLAESVASLEYYLEYLSDGTKGEESILNLARNNIEQLFDSVSKIEIKPHDTEELDAGLDLMSDNDFDMDMDLEEEIDIEEDEVEYDELLLKDEAKEQEKKNSSREKLIVAFSDETDDDIKEVFLEEFEEELEHLNSIHPRWRINPEEQTELLSEIRRIYHTLKGSGRLVGALAIGDFSWKIEDLTNLILNNSLKINDSYMEIMERSVNILPGLYEALKNESVVPDGYYEIIEDAEKVINGEDIVTKKDTRDEVQTDEKLEEIEEDIGSGNINEISNDIDDLSIDPVFVEILQQEVKGHLNDINVFVAQTQETGSRKSTEKFIRVIHTLNGAANMASVKSIVEMTTPLELLSKATNEFNKEFDHETLEKIKEFMGESKSIMEDLTNKSNVSSSTSDLGEFFKQKLNSLEQEIATRDEVSGVITEEIDLSQFIDDEKNSLNNELLDVSIDDISLQEDENLEIEEETLELEYETLELEEETLELEDETLELEDETLELEDVTLELEDETLELEDETLELEDETLELEDETLELEDETLELEDETLELEDGTLELEDETLELEDETLELEDETLELEDETLELEEDTLELEEDTLELEDETLELEEDTLELEDETLELEDETLELEDEALELEDETLELEDETLELEDETLELEEDTLELEDETLELEDETLELEDEVLELEDEVLELEEDTLELEDEALELDDEILDTEKESTESKNQEEHISAVISTSYGNKLEEDTQESSSDFDEELLEIFKEEADEILDRTEHVLSDLEESPDDENLIIALQRDLHTLKGGARMANLENIGELSHVLESLLENIGEEKRTVDKTTLGTIHDSFDLLNNMMRSDDLGGSTDIESVLNQVRELVGLEDGEIPEESKLDQDYFAPIDPLEIAEDTSLNDDEQVAEITQHKKKSNVLSGNQIKVNSELLDNLVNYAGEVSIYRSRLEQEIGSFRINLSELGNTVSRIKEQLRKLDAETEAQIISTFQTDEEDDTFDPLEMDRFSQLQQLSRSLTESVSDLTSIHSYLDDVARTSDNLLTQQSRVNTELQEGLMETRLVSFNSIVPRLRRLVRTTSNELDKPVKLEVHGAEGEMDKTVLEGVIAPLEHMIRNSLAHGIEEDRNKAKKDKQGSIVIDVRREATEVVISVTDDGAGINRKKVRKLALDKGLIKKGARLSDQDIDRLILNSGFSTVDNVSKLAGRGVGMDVVSNQINILGGNLDISSEPQVGTKFSIRLPYTLALSSALLVEIAETVYAIPVSGLEGIIRMSHSDYLEKSKDKNFVYEYANEEYQLQELNNLLSLDSEVFVENNQIPLVMIRSGENGVALRVDRILGSREIVVKTVGAQISSVPGIYGATILGDGNVVLILDIIPLSRSHLMKLESLDSSELEIIQEEIERDPIVMIVDDSITMRKVGERILRRNDYDVVTAKDGLDALDHLKEVIPDIMLLDIEMPRMDGYELAIEMKKEEKYANIPIIMITSRTGEKHRQKAMDLGVDRYLGKPYQEADLLANISGLIEEKSE